MNFLSKIGPMAIGSRLRLLSEKMTKDAGQLYQMYGLDFQANWFPVFHVLSTEDNCSICRIAEIIGHSHPSVSKMVKEMVRKNLVIEQPSPTDGRKNIIQLSPKGTELLNNMKPLCNDLGNVVDNYLSQCNHNLWKALEEWEYLLQQKSLIASVMEIKKERMQHEITIVSFEDQYKNAFKILNEEWIHKYFQIESVEMEVLNNPKEYILDKGGAIFVALLNHEPVGVCALVKMEDDTYEFELAKMAVSPKAQGNGIGFLLGKAIIEKAKDLGASKIYLESNTILTPALKLYQKLGFQKVIGRESPYERCNIQMELDLN